MTQFPPIDVATLCAVPSCKVDAEYTHKARDALEHLARYDGTHDYPYCWGYTIFRTVYTPGSDERIAAALERLTVYARYFVTHDTQLHERVRGRDNPVDARPNEELIRRYYTEMVEDEQSLAGISESEVGERFDAWVAQHRNRPRAQGTFRERNTRFEFCMMLDEESLDNILALPQDPYAAQVGSYSADEDDEDECYVKVVSNRIKSTEEPCAVGRYWLRVGIIDFLWPMWFFTCDSDILIEEMGVYDTGDGIQNLWGTPHDWDRVHMAAHFG